MRHIRKDLRLGLLKLAYQPRQPYLWLIFRWTKSHYSFPTACIPARGHSIGSCMADIKADAAQIPHGSRP